MKKTQFIELIKNIKKTMVSFISITMFIALSIAIFTGVSWSSKAVTNSIDNLFEKYKYRDVELIFPYGMSQEDIETISKLDGVDEIEGSYTGYSFFRLNGTRYQAKLIQIRNNLEKPILIDGRLPIKENEIAVSDLFAEQNNLHIGDTIVFDSDKELDTRGVVLIYNFNVGIDDLSSLQVEDNHIMAYLNTDTFVITGLTESTEFLSVNPNTFGVALINDIQLDCFIYLPECAFDSSSFLGYTDVIIRNNELRKYSSYDKEYNKISNELSQYIREAAANDIAKEKTTTVKNNIQSIIDDTQNRLDDAKAQIESAEKQIKEGKIALANAKQQLDEALPKLEDGEKEYEDAKNELDYYNSIFRDAVSLYNNIKANLNVNDYIQDNKDSILKMCANAMILCDKYNYPIIKSYISEIVDHINAGDYISVKSIIEKYETEIEMFLAQVDATIGEYYKQLDNARQTLDDAWAQYYEGLETYENMKIKLARAEKELKEAKIQYEEGVIALEDFKQQTAEFVEYGCTTLARGTNVSSVVGQTLSEMLGKLRYSMASLFVIVGLLVCYSGISRIVNDQIIDIGTKKALGLNQKEVTLYYLSYTGLCIVLGCVLGNAIGYFLVEPVLVNALSTTFVIKLNTYFSIKDALLISLLEVVLLLTITFVACSNALHRTAIDLLKGPEIPQGKLRFYEKLNIWKNLSLFKKTIINNCFNEKRRVFGTIVGILGSTALVVTSLTLNNNILDSYQTQYDEIFFFDTIVSYNYEKPEGKQEIINLFDKYNIEYADTLYTRLYIKNPDDSMIYTFAYVPEDIEQFKKKFNLISVVDYGAEPYVGLWMSDAYRACYDLKSNDTVKFTTVSGEQCESKIDGYFENYLTNCVTVIDKQTYTKMFNLPATSNSFLIEIGNLENRDEFENELKIIDGYVNTITHKDYSTGSFIAFKSVSRALVAIYMALSVLMAFLVILNLLTMFIDEKKRELTVLMINGFTIKQARKYIYSDTIFLTIIGIILGLIVGSVMGNLSVRAFESNQTEFLHRIDPMACLIAIGVTTLLTLIVSSIALKKINKFKLTDINKQ